MVRVNNGYLFEAKSNADGKSAVAGAFKAIRRGNKVHITFTLGITPSLKMCCPVVGDLSNGFISLSGLCSTEEELRRWVASNRSFYYLVGEFGTLADGMAIVHDDGHVDMSKVSLFVPASFVAESSSFGGKPAIMMLRLSENKGAGFQTVSPTFLKGYMNHISDFLKSVDSSSKFTFLDSLLKCVKENEKKGEH